MKTTIKYLILLISISANAQLEQKTTNYSYDNLNRLVQVVFHNGIVYEYQYDNLGNRLGKTIEVELPQDNYDINTVGLSCINSNDGIINIEVDRKNSYNVEIRKPIPGAEILSFTIKASNDWKLEAQNFEGERYLITITIDG